MRYELKSSLLPKCIFTDDGFSMGEKPYSYDYIETVKLSGKATVLTDAIISININDSCLNVPVSKKQEDEGLEVFELLQDVVSINHSNPNIGNDNICDYISAGQCREYL